MTRAERERRQTEGIFALIRDILSDKSIETITFENKHCSVMATRGRRDEKTFAIGFGADIDGADDYDEDDSEDEE